MCYNRAIYKAWLKIGMEKTLIEMIYDKYGKFGTLKKENIRSH